MWLAIQRQLPWPVFRQLSWPVGQIFKLLDPEEECLVLMGEKYFFIPIYEEVLRIFNMAKESDNNGARLNA